MRQFNKLLIQISHFSIQKGSLSPYWQIQKYHTYINLIFTFKYMINQQVNNTNHLQMQSDRFISNSNSKSRHITNFPSLKETNNKLEDDPKVTKLYRMLVMNEGCKENIENQMQYNSLKCINDENEPDRSYQYLTKLGIDVNKLALGPTIINKPDRILEALSLSDNFYLNLLDCSSESVLAVGLSRGIYLWKPSGSISRIRQQPDISCIQWNPTKPYLIACGSKSGGMEIWDVEQNICIADYLHHEARIGSLAWMQDSHCILSGSKDSNIFSYDLRMSRRTAKYRFHNQQICALKVQNTGNNLGSSETFASGSNDRNLIIWNTRMKAPQQIYKHSAAVKGISWHPCKSGILASGGGTEDRCIKIWNTKSNQLVKCMDTGSQICNLMYIKNGQQLVSTHGFNKFQTNVWDSTNLIKQQSLIGHTKRVLYLTTEPYSETIITGAGDQTIRFWKLKSNKKKEQNNEIADSIMTIR